MPKAQESLVYQCNDCQQTMPIPFDNGDGKVRCAACAVDYYMKSPFAGVKLNKEFIVDLSKIT